MEQGKVFSKPGMVSVVDLSGFYSYNKSDTITDQDAQRFSANLYADISSSYPETTRKHRKHREKDNEFEVERVGPTEWRYNVNLPHSTSLVNSSYKLTESKFREMDQLGGVVIRSDRWVYANASCQGYHLIRPEKEDNTRFHYKRGPNDKVQKIGPALWDATSTYYLAEFTPDADLQPGKFRHCGVKTPNTPRCAHIYVVQLVPDNNITHGVDFSQSMIYICNSEVSKVQKARLPKHELSDDIAFSAGSSLAYSGMWGLDPDHSKGLAYSMYPVR